MAMPTFTMRQLLEAGVHFGHQTRRWNPKMAPYIFGVRNGIHIIDLTQTVPMLHRALRGGARRRRRRRPRPVRRHQAPGAGAGRRRGQALRPVLRQPPLARRHADQLEDDLAARSSGCASSRSSSAEQAAGPDQEGAAPADARARQARARARRHQGHGRPARPAVRDRHQQGIDRGRRRRNTLGIPVVAVLDTNSDPDGITYPIPGNDDACARSNLYCDLVVGRGARRHPGRDGGLGHRRRRARRSCRPRRSREGEAVDRAPATMRRRPRAPVPAEGDGKPARKLPPRSRAAQEDARAAAS